MHEMKEDLLKKVNAQFSTHEGLRGQPATDAEINAAEKNLTLNLMSNTLSSSSSLAVRSAASTFTHSKTGH